MQNWPSFPFTEGFFGTPHHRDRRDSMMKTKTRVWNFFLWFATLFLFTAALRGGLPSSFRVERRPVGPPRSPGPQILEEGFVSGSGSPVRIAIAGLMRRPVDLALWLKHHRELGVQRFYIRLEDSPGAEEQLRKEADVWFETGKSDPKGNNYETLMHRQLEFVNRMLGKAREEGIEWLFHLDADELLEGTLQETLQKLPEKVKCITIENVEAVYRGDEDSCFSSREFLRCSKGAPCRSYINSKPAARPLVDVQLAGPHNFSYRGKIRGEEILAISFEDVRILHFDSCSFGAWMEKFAHLAKNAEKNKIPFPYYRDSIDAAQKAAEVYMKYRGSDHHKVDYHRT